MYQMRKGGGSISMSEDPTLLRDEHGNPLISIFHKSFLVGIDFYEDGICFIFGEWENAKKLLLKIFDATFTPMKIHDVDYSYQADEIIYKDEEDEK